jgi:hypothetical protein
MKNLQEFVEKKNDIKVVLPAIHTTTFSRFLNIKEKGSLIPTPCDRFVGQDLLYFFYGKAAYVTKGKNENTSARDALPVCFILKIDDAVLSKVFPFDSGAYLTNRYSNAFDETFDISLFELTPNFQNINNYISTYFDNINNYLSGKCTSLKNAAISELAYEAFLQLLKTKTAVAYDDRCNSVEIISKVKIILENNVLATIVPSQFLSDKEIMDFLNKIGGSIYTYLASEPHNYENLVGKVRQEADNFVQKYSR